MSKKYLSRDWLYLRHIIQKVSVDDIAKECDVAPITIYRKLWQFRIVDKRKTDNPVKLKGKYYGKEIR